MFNGGRSEKEKRSLLLCRRAGLTNRFSEEYSDEE
jgi:hypothetical protein